MKWLKLRLQNLGTMELFKSIQLQEIVLIAHKAADAVMKIYETNFDVEYKEDNSPLTQADLQANTIICQTLQQLYPTIPIMSEETIQTPFSERKKWSYYWCIDPIDGTKEFVKKNGEFTINIALIHNNEPVLGVVYVPTTKTMYSAKKGEGAFKNDQKLPLLTNENPQEKLVVATSRSHLSQETLEFIAALDTKNIEHIRVGSSLKLCMVAEGVADIYPRMAPTSEWDTAAADAIVREAGKMTYQFGTEIPLVYNKEELLNPWFIVRS